MPRGDNLCIERPDHEVFELERTTLYGRVVEECRSDIDRAGSGHGGEIELGDELAVDAEVAVGADDDQV